MPRALFDQTLVPRRKNRRPYGTVTLSVMLHGAALAVVLALQFTSSLSGLIVASPLPAFIVAPPPNPIPPIVTPPPPTPSRTAPTAISVATAPTIPPEHIGAEPPIALGGPPAPPDLNVGTIGTGLPTIPTGTSTITMAPPPAPRPTTVRVGTVKAPTRLVYVPPVYPSVAQIARVEGEVTLEATIDESGAVRNVVVRQSVPLLDRAAVDAVSRWRYSPTLLNGQPVSVIMLVTVKFTLK